jgi:hypothetical protein
MKHRGIAISASKMKTAERNIVSLTDIRNITAWTLKNTPALLDNRTEA